jgi:hypothetical protein
MLQLVCLCVGRKLPRPFIAHGGLYSWNSYSTGMGLGLLPLDGVVLLTSSIGSYAVVLLVWCSILFVRYTSPFSLLGVGIAVPGGSHKVGLW